MLFERDLTARERERAASKRVKATTKRVFHGLVVTDEKTVVSLSAV
jgi:hypothetical protein